MKPEIEFVYGKLTTNQKREIVNFWVEERALSEEKAKERVNEIASIAKNSNQEIIGVSTIKELLYQPIGQKFWFFRAYVNQEYRKQGIALTFITQAKVKLNEAFKAGEDQEIIGMLLKVENEILKKQLPQATWPRTQFHYVGSHEGNPIRISYFEGATVS